MSALVMLHASRHVPSSVRKMAVAICLDPHRIVSFLHCLRIPLQSLISSSHCLHSLPFDVILCSEMSEGVLQQPG